MWLAFKFHRNFIQIKIFQTSHYGGIFCWHHPPWQGQRTKSVGWGSPRTQHFTQGIGGCALILFQTEIKANFLLLLWIRPYWSHLHTGRSCNIPTKYSTMSCSPNHPILEYFVLCSFHTSSHYWTESICLAHRNTSAEWNKEKRAWKKNLIFLTFPLEIIGVIFNFTQAGDSILNNQVLCFSAVEEFQTFFFLLFSTFITTYIRYLWLDIMASMFFAGELFGSYIFYF